MTKINNLKLKALKQTQAFYNWELKKEGLTEKERASYLLAKRSIEKIIKEKEKAGEIEKTGEKKKRYLDKFGGYRKRFDY